MPLYTLPKEQRLYLRDAISRLFAKGSSVAVFPYRAIFRFLPESDPQTARVAIMTVAPKKKFKHAVDRNHVKRLTREAYRLNKLSLCEYLEQRNLKLQVAFLYLDNKFISFDETQQHIQRLLQLLQEKSAHCRL